MVKENDFVLVHYTGTFDDGEVFDTSMDGEPLEFQVGGGMVIPGFESAVVGMKINEEKNFRIPCTEAYGEYDDQMIYPVPLDEMKKNFEPEVGMMIAVQNQDGGQMPAIIKEITDTTVFLDLNNPLAGKDLNFSIKLLEINSEAKYPDSHNHDCSDHGCSDQGCSGCC
jgi:peptidylprolyl isomerase